MISDDEQKTLSDVESRLMAEDPEFVRSFHDRLRRTPVTKGVSNYRLAVGTATLFGVVLLLAGLAGGALAFLIATAVLFAIWSCSKGPDPERPGPGETGR